MIKVYLGTQLKTALERATEWAGVQRKEANSMTLAWSQFVTGWRKMLLDYKKDQSKANPFEEPDPGKFACVYASISKPNNLNR